MKLFVKELPDNTYILSEIDICAIHALCLHPPDGMTVRAEDAIHEMEKMFRMHDAIGKVKVWCDLQ